MIIMNELFSDPRAVEFSSDVCILNALTNKDMLLALCQCLILLSKDCTNLIPGVTSFEYMILASEWIHDTRNASNR
jgi:hypothetical protein